MVLTPIDSRSSSSSRNPTGMQTSATRCAPPKIAHLETSPSVSAAPGDETEQVASQTPEEWLLDLQKLTLGSWESVSSDPHSPESQYIPPTTSPSDETLGLVNHQTRPDLTPFSAASVCTATNSFNLPTPNNGAIIDAITGLPIKKTRFNNVFDFPHEVLDKIYFHFFRPDCHIDTPTFCHTYHECTRTHRGCTNILLMCSGVYFEAVEVLHLHENAIFFKATRGLLFRNMRDFGRPRLMNCDKRGFQCFMPPRFSELSFLRLRRVAIVIDVPNTYLVSSDVTAEYPVKLAMLKTNISSMTSAIEKSSELQQIRLMIKRAEQGSYCENRWNSSAPFSHGEPEDAVIDKYPYQMQRVLRPLLDTAIE